MTDDCAMKDKLYVKLRTLCLSSGIQVILAKKLLAVAYSIDLI